MQRVDGQVALVDVRPDVVERPVGEWADLPDPARLVVLHLARIGTGRSLVTTQAGDPRIERTERTAEWFDLAETTAGVRVGFPEPIAVRGGLLVERRPVKRFDRHVVALLDGLPERVRLREQDTRVEREDARIGASGEGHLEQDRLLLLEGAGECDAWLERLERGRDDHVRSQKLRLVGRKWQGVNGCHLRRKRAVCSHMF